MISTRSLARPLLSAVFVSGGIDTLRNPKPRVEKAAPVVTGVANTLGVPADPELLVKLNAWAQLGAGILLSIGKARRLSALILLGSAIPTTYAGHRFWELDDEQTRAQQRIHFLKNLGLIGGLLLAVVDTEGAPSVTWRVRRRAGQVRTVAGRARAVTNVGRTVAGQARRSGSTLDHAARAAIEHLPLAGAARAD